MRKMTFPHGLRNLHSLDALGTDSGVEWSGLVQMAELGY